METKALILLLLLQSSHFLCDYTQLSRPWMLKAKRFGTPLLPIFCHALAHAILIGIILHFYLNGSMFKFDSIDKLFLFQLVTHFAIDVAKGKINYHIPACQDNTGYAHWILFGADQMLHQVVLILTVYLAYL